MLCGVVLWCVFDLVRFVVFCCVVFGLVCLCCFVLVCLFVLSLLSLVSGVLFRFAMFRVVVRCVVCCDLLWLLFL